MGWFDKIIGFFGFAYYTYNVNEAVYFAQDNLRDRKYNSIKSNKKLFLENVKTLVENQIKKLGRNLSKNEVNTICNVVRIRLHLFPNESNRNFVEYMLTKDKGLVLLDKYTEMIKSLNEIYVNMFYLINSINQSIVIIKKNGSVQSLNLVNDLNIVENLKKVSSIIARLQYLQIKFGVKEKWPVVNDILSIEIKRWQGLKLVLQGFKSERNYSSLVNFMISFRRTFNQNWVHILDENDIRTVA